MKLYRWPIIFLIVSISFFAVAVARGDPISRVHGMAGKNVDGLTWKHLLAERTNSTSVSSTGPNQPNTLVLKPFYCGDTGCTLLNTPIASAMNADRNN